MSTLITVLHVIVCLFLMLTVLLQSGKGGGMGAAFGGGNAATVFGGSGASNFLKRLTAIAGTIFMITSMVLAFISSQGSEDSLSKFGKEQDEIATQKEKAKLDSIRSSRGGAGSGSAGSATTPNNSTMDPITPTPGSATTPEQPADGSATAPAAGSAEKPAPGSAAAPAAGSAEKPAATTAPAEKPAAPAEKPAATTPAPAPATNDATGSAAPAGSSPNAPKPN